MIAAQRITILVMFAASSAAEDVQMWHWWTNEVDLTRRVSLVLHGQFRSTRPLGEFLQARTGPILRLYVKPKTALVAGYFYRGEPNRLAPGWGDSHRYFGGFEDYRFVGETGSRAATLLETRFLTERFYGGPAGTLTNYTRFRYRNRWSQRDWRVSPLLGYEVFFFTDGLWGHRPHGGIRWRAGPRVMLDVGYYWDGRAPRAGQSLRLDFVLRPLAEVKDQANPNYTWMQTETPAIRRLVEPRNIRDLPLNGRNFVQLAQLLAGIFPGTPGFIAGEQGRASLGEASPQTGDTALNANGMRDSANRYFLDGIEFLDFESNSYPFSPSIDSLAEVKVETSAYSAL